MSLYFVIIKKGEIVNTNNVKNVICIIRSSCVLIITKYKDMLRKVTVNKFLTGNTRYFYVASTTSLQVWTNVIPSLVQVIKEVFLFSYKLTFLSMTKHFHKSIFVILKKCFIKKIFKFQTQKRIVFPPTFTR
jgi:hypothetical protein